MSRVYFVSGTAQVELKSGRVQAPASVIIEIQSATSAACHISPRIL